MPVPSEDIVALAFQKILETNSQNNLPDALKQSIINTGYSSDAFDAFTEMIPGVPLHPYIALALANTDTIVKALSHVLTTSPIQTIPQTLRRTSGHEVIKSEYSAIVVGDYRIRSGESLKIEAGAIFKIS